MFNMIEHKLSGRFNVSNRIALQQFDDFSFGDNSSDDSSGGSDALSSILSTVQAGASIYSSFNSSPAPTPTPTPVSNNISAHATGTSMTSLITIGVLLVVGIFAYKQLA